MKRNTLGGLSPSQLNSRNGNGPGRVMNQSTKKRMTGGSIPRPSIGRQPSLAAGNRLSGGNPRTSMPRRSSMYGGGGTQTRTDPRPLSDKSYQQSCIRTLITYLTHHGYDHAISPKLLTSPTSKEFLHIVQFLFKKVDSNIKFLGKVEDEVPVLFKRLGYPFQISKSALYAVGSPHTWPGLLAALNWIVELLTYEEQAEESKEGGASFDDNGQLHVFNDYVGQAYQHFLAGDDENCALLDEQLEQTFKEKDLELGAELERLMHANSSLQAELEAIKTRPSELEVLESKQQDFLSDIGKFNKLITSLQAHQQALEKKIEEKKGELAGKQAEAAEVRVESEEVRLRLAAQQINLGDVERMSREKSKMKEILRHVTGQREGLDKTVWDAEVLLSKKLEDLEGAVLTYHTTGDRLKLIPATAKRAEGIVYEIRLNTRGGRPEEMVGADLKGVIKPGLQQLKEKYSGMSREGQQEALVLEERRGKSEVGVVEMQEAKEALDAQVKKIEVQVKAEKEKQDAEVRTLVAESEAVEEYAAQLASSSAAAVPECEERYQTALTEHEKTKLMGEEKLKSATEQVTRAVDLLVDHKTHIEEKLREMDVRFSSIQSSLQDPIVV